MCSSIGSSMVSVSSPRFTSTRRTRMAPDLNVSTMAPISGSVMTTRLCLGSIVRSRFSLSRTRSGGGGSTSGLASLVAFSRFNSSSSKICSAGCRRGRLEIRCPSAKDILAYGITFPVCLSRAIINWWARSLLSTRLDDVEVLMSGHSLMLEQSDSSVA